MPTSGGGWDIDFFSDGCCLYGWLWALLLLRLAWELRICDCCCCCCCCGDGGCDYILVNGGITDDIVSFQSGLKILVSLDVDDWCVGDAFNEVSVITESSNSLNCDGGICGAGGCDFDWPDGCFCMQLWGIVEGSAEDVCFWIWCNSMEAVYYQIMSKIYALDRLDFEHQCLQDEFSSCCHV